MAALTMIRARVQSLEQIRALVEDAVLRHLEATGTEIVVGEVRYYAGHRSATKCVDPMAVMESLLASACGDVGRIVECLVSNPYELTEVRLVCDGGLPDGAFATEQRPKLLEGKPKKVLLSSNERFAKGRRPTAAASVPNPDLAAAAAEVF